MAKAKRTNGAKKPITKRWWFWLIVVVIVFGAVGSVRDTGKQAENDAAQQTAGNMLAQSSASADVSSLAPDVPEDNMQDPESSKEMDQETEPSSEQAPEPEKSASQPSQDPVKVAEPEPLVTEPEAQPEPSEPEQESEPEPEPSQTPSTIRGLQADTVVYVSTRTNTIHSVSDCSGMKNYKEMTIGDADARGYKYCPNCW